MSTKALNAFVNKHAKQHGRFVAARLQAALALLERLRDVPSLKLSQHLCRKGAASIKSHESYGNKALQRLNLKAINTNHGRRSSNLPDWGQELLNLLKKSGFLGAASGSRRRILDEAQKVFAVRLRAIIEEDPIQANLRSRTAEAVIKELILAAEKKGKSGEVAQYLVGAKLELRLNRKMRVYPANKSDRTSLFDRAPRLGDFEIENAVIEVAMGRPDDKHLQQIAEILNKSEAEVWLLVRSDRVFSWENELEKQEGIELRRVVIKSVEGFVGQNITELGEFSAKNTAAKLKALFDLYNKKWVKKLGPPGIRIEISR